MMKTETLIDEAASLPVGERLRVVESLLQSLNQPEPEIDEAWAAEARRRLAEMRSGQVQGIPGEVVFARIRERLAK